MPNASGRSAGPWSAPGCRCYRSILSSENAVPPSAARILEEFGRLESHRLYEHGHFLKTFEPDLTDLHRQILHLLGIPDSTFHVTT